MHDNIDRRKSAPLAIQNTQPDEGAHWIEKPLLGRSILRTKTATQAGAGADMLKQSGALYRWGEQQAYGMIERSATDLQMQPPLTTIISRK